MPGRRGLSAAVAVAAALAAGAAGAGAQDPAELGITAITPLQPHAGTPVTIEVTAPPAEPARVCLLPGAGSSRCEVAEDPDGTGVRRVSFAGLYAGRWTVVVDAAAQRLTQDITVRPHADRLVVLATGDSLVQSLAHGLAGQLHLRRDVVFKKEIELGRGLSKPDGFDWPATAADAVARWQPDVVVVFLGGNEGYDIDGHICCAADWVQRFAALQRRLMQVYEGDGSTRVYWCTMPAPGPSRPAHRIVWAAENLALAMAAADDDARVFDTSELLTPGYHWRRGMRWRGRWWVVRQDDDIHVNRVGGRIAALALLRQLRRDRIDVPVPPVRTGVGHNLP